MSSTSVTILICTRNGARTIQKCLQRCVAEMQRETAPSSELIVVDNGSTDETVAIVERVCHETSLSIRLLHATTPGKNHALEIGIRAAHSDIVAIIDDDNYLALGYLTHVVDFFNDYPGAAAVGSLNSLDEAVIAPEWFIWAGDLFACTRPAIEDHVAKDEQGREVGRTGYIAGAGMAFRRRLLIEALDAGYCFFSNTNRAARIAGEDIELVFLLRSMGWLLGYDPKMRLSHDLAIERLNEKAFFELCEMIGAGGLGVDPFLFTTKAANDRLPVTWRWQWQFLRKLKQWLKTHLPVRASSNATTCREERRFRRRRAQHHAWGAMRYLILNRSRYTKHVQQIASGPWTRMRIQ